MHGSGGELEVHGAFAGVLEGTIYSLTDGLSPFIFHRGLKTLALHCGRKYV